MTCTLWPNLRCLAWFPVLLWLAIRPSIASADLITLYDPSLGTLPGDQGWIAVVLPPATQNHTGTHANLNTTSARDSQAGYFSESPADGSLQHPLMPVLDRQLGFRVDFQLQVLSEAHDARDDNGDGKADRAGISLIAISEDLRGVELAFFEDRIWVYAAAGEGANSLFTQAEGTAYDTTVAVTNYSLNVQADSYRLRANGALILKGNLRDYNPSGVNPLLDPYDNPSFLFLGDDTTSADSNVLIGTVGIANVPEPSGTLLLPAALGLVIARRVWGRTARKRRKGCRQSSLCRSFAGKTWCERAIEAKPRDSDPRQQRFPRRSTAPQISAPAR